MIQNLFSFIFLRSTIALWLLILVAFGLLSLLIGQDANWDLQNYHIYNPWALLTGRVGVDLAPAGFQSYFNPLIDVPYYWMVMNLPPMSVGFIMGVLHGMNFIVLLEIVRLVLPAATERKTIVLLALSGCLGATFLSELGNTMGDNTTALFIFTAVLIILKSWSTLEANRNRGLWICLAAGVTIGLGIGLKLTNAPYAVGIFIALAIINLPYSSRFKLMIVFGIGVLLGISVTAGYWFVTMWEHFSNPLFPQFNLIFKSELAAAISIADTRWFPQNTWEIFLFPYIFTIWPQRFGEVTTIQLLWPIVYTLFAVWLALILAIKIRVAKTPVAPSQHDGLLPHTRFLLVFLVSSYIVWMAVFSIGRYTISMEMLFPVVVWIVLHQLTNPILARKIAFWAILMAVIVSVIRFETWGNADWSSKSYSVDVPQITQSEKATVLVLSAPIAWILPHFPQDLVFVSLNLFPESEGYGRHTDSIINTRGGDIFAIISAKLDRRATRISKLNQWVVQYDIHRIDTACRAITWLKNQLPKYKIAVHKPIHNTEKPLCTFMLPPERQLEIDNENYQTAVTASTSIATRDMSVNVESCAPYSAFIGARKYVYQFCNVDKQVVSQYQSKYLEN